MFLKDLSPWKWYISVTTTILLMLAGWITMTVASQTVSLAEMRVQMIVLQISVKDMLAQVRAANTFAVRQEGTNEALKYRLTKLEDANRTKK